MRRGAVVLILLMSLVALMMIPIHASRISFDYKKPLGRFSRFLEVEFIGDGIRESFIGEDIIDLFIGEDIIDLRALPPRTYYIVARWMGIEVGRWASR